MLWGGYLSLLLAVHPSCLPFLRQTEETLFQAQTALQTLRADLAKLQQRTKTMTMLHQEGAISRRQWDNFQAKVKETQQEIANLEKIAQAAKNQLKTLQTMPQCSAS
ncbi:MAG: hypothetical protein RMK91_11740 [Pseudanabaenaceae cyanobacterium SKYGB_i_bin29]|nr:hypothetical protein [Pseudanabaenaceae cyanobacterium SKYG29]MDW8422525.1 hypothetical protein [Pseudanabaenaceae cyanobacterium SKYGB_i_bin29]